MIKTWLKHCIFELCIDKIFEGIQDNFHIYDVNLLGFGVGDFLQIRVYFEDRDYTLRKCQVKWREGKNMVIRSYDPSIPVNLIVKDGVLEDMTTTPKNFNEYFTKNDK